MSSAGGELVPLQRKPDSGGAGTDSPFDRFLDNLIPGEPPDDDFTKALMYAALGAFLVMAGAAILAILPSGDSIRESSFILVGKRTTANAVEIGDSMALPLVLTSLVLLAGTGGLWLAGNNGAVGAAVCAVQPGVGVVSVCAAAIPWALVALVVIATIVIWILVCVFLFAFAISVIAGAFQ